MVPTQEGRIVRNQSVLLIVAALVLLAGCSASGAAQGATGGLAAATAPAAAVSLATGPATAALPAATATSQPTADAAVAAASTQVPTVAAEATTSGSAAATTADPSNSATAGAIRLTMQPDSQVSYRVREQLANLQFPSDAVGTTKAMTGTVIIQPDGKILTDQSKFVVDLSTLASDSGMRDGFIKRNTLQTGTYPEAVFVPTAVDELPTPLPASGDVSFKLVGGLTVRGVTKQVTWDVQGKVAGNELTGTATTALKFEDFGMTPPKTMMALSVQDNITLQVAYHMTATKE
jgi:polyisoprenoid-binding protein YceI